MYVIHYSPFLVTHYADRDGYGHWVFYRKKPIYRNSHFAGKQSFCIPTGISRKLSIFTQWILGIFMPTHKLFKLLLMASVNFQGARQNRHRSVIVDLGGSMLPFALRPPEKRQRVRPYSPALNPKTKNASRQIPR